MMTPEDIEAMDDDERAAAFNRLMGQLDAFNTVTIACGNCGKDAPLEVLRPTARGFVCQRCLVAMPTDEFRERVLDGNAVEAEFLL